MDKKDIKLGKGKFLEIFYDKFTILFIFLLR